MIDLHCHLLPGIDDGAPDLDASLKMARIAVDDGIEVIACTPHIYPGLFENDAAGIRRHVETLRGHLAEAGIPLKLTWGADAHVDPNLMARLKAGTAPSLNDTRYFLLEPPHHVAPPHFAQFTFNFLAAGYVPVITHPERLSWIEEHYATFCDLADKGVWMQVTAGSLTGRFGQAARYWGERMLDEGRVHILATDAHSPDNRPPLLAEGREAAAKWVGEEEARHLVETRPLAILRNLAPESVPQVPPAKTITAKAGNKLILPVDAVIADKFEAEAASQVVDADSIPAGWRMMDIGRKSMALLKLALQGAKLIVWNGPMGVFEMPRFAEGTLAMAKLLADSGATTVIGGGDSASAVKKAGVARLMTHVSTGGGASLEFLEGKELPGLAALNDK